MSAFAEHCAKTLLMHLALAASLTCESWCVTWSVRTRALVVTADAMPDPNDGLFGCGEGASVGERGAPRQVQNTRRSRRVPACCLDGPAVGATATVPLRPLLLLQ